MQVHQVRPRRKARDKASLNQLAADFVAGLQAALPSTVPTILRTACKLQARHYLPALNHLSTILVPWMIIVWLHRCCRCVAMLHVVHAVWGWQRSAARVSTLY